MKKNLFISPFPPPLTGAAYISQEIYNKLSDSIHVIKIAFLRGDLHWLFFSQTVIPPKK